MEKTITLRLLKSGRIRIVEDENEIDESVIGYQSENNATSLKLILCSDVYGLKHYLEFLAPNGQSTSTTVLTEVTSGTEHSVTLPLTSEFVSEEGRYAVQYVGRNQAGTQTLKSAIIALDVGQSINALQPDGSNSDWIAWAENEFEDLDDRVTELEQGESAEVHSDSTFSVNEGIIVADGTGGKKIKDSGVTIAALKAEVELYADGKVSAEATARGEAVSAEALLRANADTAEARARADADAALGNRVTALENGEAAEVHAAAAFGIDEIILVADGATGKNIKAGTKTIAQILSLITDEASARGSADTVLGGRIDALKLQAFLSVSVSGASVTLNDLETSLNQINTRGEHVFFDLHTYADRAYICTVTFYEANSVKYCFIEDIINNKTYVNYAGVVGSETVADYIQNNVTDKLQVVKLTDEEMTFGEVKTILDKINSIGGHVLFDVSAFGAGAYLCAIFISGLPYKLFDIVSGKIATGVYDPEEPIINILTATKDVATKDQIQDLQAQIDEIAGSSVVYGIRFTGNATSGTRLVSADGLQFDLSQGINDFAARPLFSDIYEVELDSKDSSGNTISGAKQKFIHFPNFYFKRTKTLDSSSNIVESWYISPIAVSGYSPVLKNADGTVPSGFLVGKYETAFKDDTEALVGSFTGKKPVVNVNRDWVQARTAYVQDATKGISNLSPIDQSLPKQAWDAIAILITILTGSRNHQSTFKGVTEDYLFNPTDAANVGNQATSAANYVVIPSNNYIVTNSSVGSKITIYSSNTQSRRWEEHLITAIEADTPSAGLTKITFDGTATIMNAGTVRIGLHTGEKTGTTDSIVGDFGNLSTDNRHAFKVFGLENYYGNFWTILGGAAIKEIWNADTSSGENHLILPEGINYTVGSDYTSYIDTEKNLSIADGYVKEVDFEGAVLIPTVTSGASSSSYFSDYYYQDHKSSAGDPAYRCFMAGGSCYNGSNAGSFFFGCDAGWTSSAWNYGFRSFILIP